MPLTPYGKAERDSARRFVRRHYPAARLEIKPNYLYLSGTAYGFDVHDSGLTSRVYVKRANWDSERPRKWEFA